MHFVSALFIWNSPKSVTWILCVLGIITFVSLTPVHMRLRPYWITFPYSAFHATVFHNAFTLVQNTRHWITSQKLNQSSAGHNEVNSSRTQSKDGRYYSDYGGLVWIVDVKREISRNVGWTERFVENCGWPERFVEECGWHERYVGEGGWRQRFVEDTRSHAVRQARTHTRTHTHTKHN